MNQFHLFLFNQMIKKFHRRINVQSFGDNMLCRVKNIDDRSAEYVIE